MPRRYKLGADGQPRRAFYGKLPEEFTKEDTLRFLADTDIQLSGSLSADTLAALRAEGYEYKDGGLAPISGKETVMQEQTDGAPAATQEPMKLDVSVRLIDPVKNLIGFASVKFNDKAKKAFMQVCPASRTETVDTVTRQNPSQRSSATSLTRRLSKPTRRNWTICRQG